MTTESDSVMAAIESRNLGHSKRGRPPMHSQQSNSVPSTPQQHARDLRFSSRSPSPNKTLPISSPHSVLSEAVGVPAAPRIAQPTICKFEKGDEFRKRRIIYTEGGNLPLSPPEQEPKKALEPDEDDKLSGDMRELYDRLLPSDDSEARRAQLVQKLEEILRTEWSDGNIKVNVFGSSGNLLSSSDSDVDVCITTPLKQLGNMHALAMALHKHGMQKVVCRAAAKVPIVKFWDPELELACDINVNNPLALENTRMIKTYVQMDDRVRPLAKIIKHWTKQRILNDAAYGGTISSYTWICMIINFLQLRDPPILPSLQKIPDARLSLPDGPPSAFADDLEQLRGYGKSNTESLGQLLFHFYRYYGYTMDYSEFVVSVKEGRAVNRKEKGWDRSNPKEKEAHSRLCVEEPFNTIRNLGNSADEYSFVGIHKEIRRAFDLIKDGTHLAQFCEQYEFPLEEKPLFQRPPPKPKPTLTRSASQSGGSKPGHGGGRANNNTSTRNSRNTSNQRSGNRRASSGANYANQRLPYVMSPPVGVNGPDYFAATSISRDQLHDQLYKQYQFLQVQQEALRNQLLQQQQTQAQLQAQQAQAQAQGRNGDVVSSPRQRQFTNGVPTPQSPRTFEAPVNTTQLLPGYSYHYPSRYPHSSPLAQSRNPEETVTNPSSPSLATATPQGRRGIHRSSVNERSTQSSTRSQSQPGRSFPNPLAIQGLVHPSYDISGALATPYLVPRSVQTFPTIQANGTIRQPNGLMTLDTAIPKEYVGYYVGQSPQLIPQYQAANLSQIPQLRDMLGSTSRQLSPETVPSLYPNGMRHVSRSPSPLGRARSYSNISNPRSVTIPLLPRTQPKAEPRGPLIVNGSNAGLAMQKTTSANAARQAVNSSNMTRPTTQAMVPTEQIQQLSLDALPPHTNGLSHGQHMNGSSPPHQPLVISSNPALKQYEQNLPCQELPATMPQTYGHKSLSQHVSPNSFPGSRQPFSNSAQHGEASEPQMGAVNSQKPVISPLPATPVLLSPVKEARTPSPTANRSPHMSRLGPHHKLPSIAAASSLDVNGGARHEPQSQILNGTTNDHSFGDQTRSYQPMTVASGNTWQQAPGRKSHKKSKSTGAAKVVNGTKLGGGEPLPANEADRKGG